MYPAYKDSLLPQCPFSYTCCKWEMQVVVVVSLVASIYAAVRNPQEQQVIK
jgi:uncharacterized membrane protein